jgi:hypothetical protein
MATNQFVPLATVKALFVKKQLTRNSYIELWKNGKLPAGFPSRPTSAYGRKNKTAGKWGYFTGHYCRKNGAK